MLWEYDNTYDITLAHDFTDYDFLVFEGQVYQGSECRGGQIISSTELESIRGVSNEKFTLVGALNKYANYLVVSKTSLTYYDGDSRVTRVWGIKLRSGGSSSSTALTDLIDVTITSVQDDQDLSYDSTSSKWINKTKQVSLTMSEYNALPDTKLTDGISYFITDMNVVDGYTDLIGTLTAGSTSLTISSELLTTDSTIDIYTSAFGVNPTNVVLSTGSVTLTFESQQSDLSVKVRVSGDRLPSVSGGSGSVDNYLTSTITVTEENE